MTVDGTGRDCYVLGSEALLKTEKRAREGAVASSSHRRPSVRIIVVTCTKGAYRAQARGGSESASIHNTKFRPIFRITRVAYITNSRLATSDAPRYF